MQRMFASQVPAGTYTLEVHEQLVNTNTSHIQTVRNGKLLDE